jgi:DNA-binding transcriptional LysR family regulator
MEEEAIAIEREVSGQATSLVGIVRLTAPDGLGSVFLVPLLAQLRAHNPGIELELAAENRVFSLSKREADMALRVGKPAESLVVARHVADLGYALYASRAYVDEHGRPPDDDFSGHTFVAYEEPFSSTTPEGIWLAARTSHATCALRTSSTHVQLRAALAGMGLVVLPCYIADPEPSLVRLRPPSQVVTSRVWLVVHPDLRHAARIRATADFLAEAIEKRRPELAGAPRRRPKS